MEKWLFPKGSITFQKRRNFQVWSPPYFNRPEKKIEKKKSFFPKEFHFPFTKKKGAVGAEKKKMLRRRRRRERKKYLFFSDIFYFFFEKQLSKTLVFFGYFCDFFSTGSIVKVPFSAKCFFSRIAIWFYRGPPIYKTLFWEGTGHKNHAVAKYLGEKKQA